MSDTCGSTDTSSNEPCQWNEADKGPCPFHNGEKETPDNGRPSKISKELVDNITAKIAEGRSDNAAFRLNDLDPKTKYNWLDRVEPEEVPLDPDFEDDPYAYFFRRYTHARGLGEEFYFDTVLELALENEDHRFVASLMKQRYGDSWADTETGVNADTVKLEVSERVRDTWPNK